MVKRAEVGSRSLTVGEIVSKRFLGLGIDSLSLVVRAIENTAGGCIPKTVSLA